MYMAVQLARYIVSKCIQDGCPISNLQLQKILYYVQKEFLKSGKPAFSDDLEAWQFGPVVPSVYYRFCGFGAMPITFFGNNESLIEIDPADRAVIDSVVEEKRSLPPWDLVEETHKPGGAWDRVYQNGNGNHQTIPTELIKEFG